MLRSDYVDLGGPQRMFLRGAYAAVNWTNGLSLVEIVKEARLQKRCSLLPAPCSLLPAMSGPSKRPYPIKTSPGWAPT